VDLDEYVGWEAPDPLYDIEDDDPSKPDYGENEARVKLDELRSQFDDIFSKGLSKLPPKRPNNHFINEIVSGLRIPARVIGMPDRYKKQWTAHLLKFVECGFWSPRALNSACSMFCVPGADAGKARLVINLKTRNENSVKTASPIPDMRGVRTNLASHRAVQSWTPNKLTNTSG
jgi:hypothetical protein